MPSSGPDAATLASGALASPAYATPRTTEKADASARNTRAIHPTARHPEDYAGQPADRARAETEPVTTRRSRLRLGLMLAIGLAAGGLVTVTYALHAFQRVELSTVDARFSIRG